MMCAGLKIGGKSILQPGESETWSNPMLCQRILKTYGDDLFKDVVVERVNQTTEVSNEFFSAIFQRETPETGYEKLHFDRF